MIERGETLSALAKVMRSFPQILINVDVKQRKDVYQFPAIATHTGKVERELGDKGRLVIRASGTESKVRIMLEGEDEERIRILGHELADIIKKHLG